MNLRFSSTGIVLGRGQLLNIDHAAGTRIVSQRGVVWITQDGDPRDIVLREGDAFELDRATSAIVQAFEPAVVAISEPARVPHRRFGGAAWLRRLRAAVQALVPVRAACDSWTRSAAAAWR